MSGPDDISPWNVRQIIPPFVNPKTGQITGRTTYRLFDIECSQEVCAAYERSWARRSSMLKKDADLLTAWAIEQSLIKGDFTLATQLRDVLERLGWQPPE